MQYRTLNKQYKTLHNIKRSTNNIKYCAIQDIKHTTWNTIQYKTLHYWCQTQQYKHKTLQIKTRYTLFNTKLSIHSVSYIPTFVLHIMHVFLHKSPLATKAQVNDPDRIASKALYTYPMSICPFYAKPTRKTSLVGLQKI